MIPREHVMWKLPESSPNILEMNNFDTSVGRDVPDSEFTGYPVPVIRPDNRILRSDTGCFSDLFYMIQVFESKTFLIIA